MTNPRTSANADQPQKEFDMSNLKPAEPLQVPLFDPRKDDFHEWCERFKSGK